MRESPALEALMPALVRLDRLIGAASEGQPLPDGPLALADGEAASRLTELGAALDLEPFDLDVLLVALAPDLDDRYAAVFAALQGNRLATRPSPALLLTLLCSSAGERLARRSFLGPGAPLVRFEVVRLVPCGSAEQPAASMVEVDPRIVDFLLGEDGLDPRLEPVGSLVAPRFGLGTGGLEAVLGGLDARSLLFLAGPDAAAGLETAEALARDNGCPLLVLELGSAAQRGLDLERTLLIAAREAALHGALLCLADVDGLESRALVRLAPSISPYRLPVLAVGADEHSFDEARGIDVVLAPVAPPDSRERQWLWERALDVVPEDADVPALASRFRLGAAQIERAVDEARNRVRLRAAAGGDSRLHGEDLFAGARSRSAHRLAELTRKVEPVFGWDDIVLPDDSRAQLQEICDRVVHRDLVIDGWGFRRALGVGLGVSALFAGSSGTGKTMAAGILANELGVDLFAIDLATIVSKYIGETSKNLDRIFRAAEDANAILFFDEADALFGKRSEVRDSHDRYANVEIAYLLQKMEAYDGVAVLATNLRQNLDEAFARRLGFTVHFPFPGPEERLEIWRRVWPVEVPLAGDVDLDDLADRFRLSGGNIRNAALAAAFLAATDGSEVRRQHLLQAVRREYQKLGRGLSDEDLDGVAELAEAVR